MVFDPVVSLIVCAVIGVVGFLVYVLLKEGSASTPVAVVKDLSDFDKPQDPILKSEAFNIPTTPVESQAFEHKPFEATPLTTITTPLSPAIENIPPAPPQMEVVGLSLKEQEYVKRIEELEEEIKQVGEKSVAQAQEALNMVEQLNKERSLLKLEKETLVAEHEAKLKLFQEQVDDLKKENAHVQSQIDSKNGKIAFLESEVLAVKNQMAQELAKAKALFDEEQQKKLEAAAESNPELKAVREENQTLKQSNLDFQKSLQKLKELNDHLIEKSDLLQYELTKARAQSAGFERVCSNYKDQIEAFLKQNPTARTNRIPLQPVVEQ